MPMLGPDRVTRGREGARDASVVSSAARVWSSFAPARYAPSDFAMTSWTICATSNVAWLTIAMTAERRLM